IRHGDELPLVGRIGEDLLVPGHAGVEDQLAARLAGGPERPPPEDPAVGQRQDGVAGRLGLPHQDATRSVGVAGRSPCTSRPPTRTAVERPTSSPPSNGVWRLFERKRRAATFQRRSGSTSVTSAGAPTASVPAGSPS